MIEQEYITIKLHTALSTHQNESFWRQIQSQLERSYIATRKYKKGVINFLPTLLFLSHTHRQTYVSTFSLAGLGAAAAEREELACFPFFFFGTGPVLKQILNPLISLHTMICNEKES